MYIGARSKILHNSLGMSRMWSRAGLLATRSFFVLLILTFFAVSAASAQTAPCQHGYTGPDNTSSGSDLNSTKSPSQAASLHAPQDASAPVQNADLVSVADLRRENTNALPQFANHAGRRVVIPTHCMNVTIKSFTKPCDLRDGYMICDRVEITVHCGVLHGPK